MPDKPKAGSKKGGRTALYATLAIGGVAVAWYLYRRYASNAAAGTTSGQPSVPTLPAGPSSSPVPTTPAAPITNIAEWKAAVLQYMTNQAGIKGGENVAATGLASALSGHCVGPNEYNALNQALGAIGQPPGQGILVLQLCKQSRKPTTTHTRSEAPGTPAPRSTPPLGATRSAGAVTDARRRANDLAAAARRRANDVAATARRRANRAPNVGATPRVRRKVG